MNTVVWTTESPGFAVRPTSSPLPSSIDVRQTQWQPRGRGTIPTTQRRKVTAVGITVGAPESLVHMAARRSAA